jgi:hypothetical protein
MPIEINRYKSTIPALAWEILLRGVGKFSQSAVVACVEVGIDHQAQRDRA